LFECNAIKASNQSKISKKELFKLLMWFFNVSIARWESSLTAAKNRKLEKESPFLNALSQAYSGYLNHDLK
jgi:hypothetical protein